MPSSNIHVIGFSLGTVVTSKAGQKAQELGMEPFGRFTLLDPCPVWETAVLRSEQGCSVPSTPGHPPVGRRVCRGDPHLQPGYV
jgi:hypothetical protein